MSVLKAQPQQHISNIYIYKYVSDQSVFTESQACCMLRYATFKLEDLTVLKRSPVFLNNVKIGQDQLRLIMKHILLYGGYGHFAQVT